MFSRPFTQREPKSIMGHQLTIHYCQYIQTNIDLSTQIHPNEFQMAAIKAEGVYFIGGHYVKKKKNFERAQ